MPRPQHTRLVLAVAVPPRPCLDCGRLTAATRCTTCRRHRDRARGTTTQRGYGAEHQNERAAALADLAANPGQPCPICTQPLTTDQALDLHHLTQIAHGGKTGPRALAHAPCNRRVNEHR